MASRYYGASAGAQLQSDVSESASTTSRVVELQIKDTYYADKQGVLNAIEAIKAYIIQNETQPIA